MKYYTFLNVNKNIKRESAKVKRFQLLKIATENGEKKKASYKRYNTAKELYNYIISLNYIRERLLNIENSESAYIRATENGTIKRLETREEKTLNEAKKLAKKLNINIFGCTWYHLETNNHTQIYTSEF